MTIYIINDPLISDLTEVTEKELDLQNNKIPVMQVDLFGNPLEQIKQLADLSLDDGDVVCFAGSVLRLSTWNFKDIAVEIKKNLMPGNLIDHRGLKIPNGIFFSRKAQEENNYPGIPYVMLFGDAQGAKESWNLLEHLDFDLIWQSYKPENLTLMHWLSAAASLHQSWQSPDWFPMVDLSVRDLEISPVMYATNHWTDWISFYPSGGKFKLENHAQIHPVWLDRSTKPLEYWHE